MHKIETSTAGLSAVSILTLQSIGNGAFLTLGVDAASKMQDEKWVDDPIYRKQEIVGFFDGEPVKFSGKVLETECVECAAAHKVVVEVALTSRNLPAFAAGRMSRTLVALEVHRVLEVWISPAKCVYQADKTAPATKVLDLDSGKIGPVK